MHVSKTGNNPEVYTKIEDGKYQEAIERAVARELLYMLEKEKEKKD